MGLASFVLTRLDAQVSTPIGWMGAGRSRFPVVEIAGLGSDGSGFAPLTRRDTLSWAARVDDLVMVATPNHGSRIGFLEATLGPGHRAWDGIAADLAPNSSFLNLLGTREPPGEVYTTIGGDPWLWRWLRSGHHGFDGAVPAESPFLDGAARYTFAQTHGRLLRARSTTTLIRKVTALGVT